MTHGARGSAIRRALFLLALLGSNPGIQAVEASDDWPSESSESFLVVPLRVHVLSSEEWPEADCHLSDADVERILGKVNSVWHQAGIHFGLESIRREPVRDSGRFRAARALGEGRIPHTTFSSLRPESSRRFEGLHVYFIHDFDVNGVYFGDGTAFVKETAALREVPGGIDEPIPRVVSHELGHALGLPHRQDRTNLMASGTTGTTLNEAEIERARSVARDRDGTQSRSELEELRQAPDAEASAERRARIRRWLDELDAVAQVGGGRQRSSAAEAASPAAP